MVRDQHNVRCLTTLDSPPFPIVLSQTQSVFIHSSHTCKTLISFIYMCSLIKYKLKCCYTIIFKVFPPSVIFLKFFWFQLDSETTIFLTKSS